MKIPRKKIAYSTSPFITRRILFTLSNLKLFNLEHLLKLREERFNLTYLFLTRASKLGLKSQHCGF